MWIYPSLTKFCSCVATAHISYKQHMHTHTMLLHIHIYTAVCCKGVAHTLLVMWASHSFGQVKCVNLSDKYSPVTISWSIGSFSWTCLIPANTADIEVVVWVSWIKDIWWWGIVTTITCQINAVEVLGGSWCKSLSLVLSNNLWKMVCVCVCVLWYVFWAPAYRSAWWFLTSLLNSTSTYFASEYWLLS